MSYLMLFFTIGSPFLFKRKKLNWYYFLVSFSMIFLLSFKNIYVGTDTQNYLMTYNFAKILSFENFLFYNPDKGFAYSFYYLANLGVDFKLTLFIQYTLYIMSVTLLIKKHSKNPMFSYFIFITFGFFIFATTLRQCIAIAIVLLSFEYIIKRKPLMFFSCLILAASFHKSAYIFIIIYFLYDLNVSKKIIYLIPIMFISTFFMRFKIFEILDLFDKKGYKEASTGGYFYYMLILLLIILGYLYYEKINKSKINKLIYIMLIIILSIAPISKLNPAFFRIQQYLYIFIIIFVPNLIKSLKDKKIKFILYYFFIVLGLYYFYFKLDSYGIRMQPYYYFWEDYPIERILKLY